MALNLAPTSFNGNPDDSVVAIDVYKTPPQTPTSNMFGIFAYDMGTDMNSLFGSSLGKNAPSAIGKKVASKSSPGFFGKLGSTVGGILGDVGKGFLKDGKVDLNGAIDKVSKATGVNIGELKGMNQTEMMNKVIKDLGYKGPAIGAPGGVGYGIPGITGVGGNRFGKLVFGGTNEIKILVDDVRHTVKNVKDIKSLEQLSILVDSMAGTNGYIKSSSLTDTVAAIKAVNDMAKKYNIPNIADKLISGLQGEDKVYAILQTLDDRPTLSNLDYVNTAIDEIGNSKALSKNPNLIKDILMSYRGDNENPDPTTPAAWKKLDDTLKAIKVNWPYVDNEDKDVYNLDIFKDATDWVKQCMYANEVHMAATLVSGAYESRYFDDLTRRYYPYTSF